MFIKIFSLLLIIIILTLAKSEEINFNFEEFETIQSPLASPIYDNSPIRKFIPKTPTRNQRVIGGQAANRGQIPYQVLLYTTPTDYPSATYLCGASIISPTWLLTAAHCIYEMENATAFVGVIDRVYGPAAWRTKLDKTSLIAHPKYDETQISNDIGLINSPTEIPYGIHVGSIRIPTAAEASISLTNKFALIAGWGSARSPVQFLQVANASIASGGSCSVYYGVLNFRFSNICVNTVNNGSPCSGDSGGPLVTKINNQNVIVGIVSYGSAAGCNVGAPVVFTRVSSYLPWIKQHTGL